MRFYGLAVFFVFALTCVMLNAKEKIVVENFAESGTEVFKNVATISKDGKVMYFDTFKTSTKGFTPLVFLPKGRFEAKKQYTVMMKINVEKVSSEKDSFVHMLVRDGFEGGNDLLINNQTFTAGEINLKLPFTGDGEKGFNMQFIAHNMIKGYIKDFKIVEGILDSHVSITENPAPYDMDKSTLPVGAREFNVELPQNAKGEVVEAKRFGIIPGEKIMLKRFAEAIAYCKKVKASRLVFEKNAVYSMVEDGSVCIDGMSDFTFDGNGSTFVYRKKNGISFVVTNCRRIELRDFNMDWDWENDPLASIVKVVKIQKDRNIPLENRYIDYEFVDYKKFPYRGYVRAATLSAWDVKEKSVGVEDGLTMAYEMFLGRPNTKPKTEWVSDNVLRIYGGYNFSKKLAVGQYYRMQHYYYDMGAFTLFSNENITLRNINIWSSAGHGLVISGTQKYTYLKNVNIIIPKDKPKHVITTTADHMHVAQSCGFIKLENCEFSQGADDCINFHDCSSYGVKKSSNSIVSRHNYGADGAMIEFRNNDYSPANFSAMRTGAKKLDDGKFEIFFNSDIPGPEKSKYIMFDKTYDTRNVIVRDCYFHSNRARGILVLARDVTIENCRFRRNEMGAVKLETGYTTNIWCEGFGVDNVVLRNNIFDTSNPLGVSNFGYERDVFIGAYIAADPSYEQTSYPILKNILFEGNTFKDTFGMVATIASASNVTFWKNTFINFTPRNTLKEYRGSFFVTSSSNIRIVDNMYIKSPNVKNPSVYFDKETVSNVVVQGNRLLDKVDLN